MFTQALLGLALLTALAAPTEVHAQDRVEPADPVTGLDASVSFDSNHGGDGTWMQLTSGVGYTLSPRWSVAAGLPIYYVTPGATYEGTSSLTGLGDLYGSVSLDLSLDAATFYTTFTASAPTGSVDSGLGAGQAGWDLSGHFATELGRLGPYVTGGFGNNIKTGNESLGTGAGTARPAKGVSTGRLTHVEAGIEVGIWQSSSITGTTYGIFDLKTPEELDEVSDHGVGLVLWGQLTPSLDLSLWISHSLAYIDYTIVSISATYSWKSPGH